MSNNTLKAIICYFLIILPLFGCVPEGLKRTPLGNREKQSFPTLGFSMELPQQPKDKYEQYLLKLYDAPDAVARTHCKGDISIRMHPFWSGQILAEPLYFIEIMIIRLSSDEFKNFQLGKHPENGRLLCSDNESGFFSQVTEKIAKDPDNPQYIYSRFRKDIVLPNGDVVVSVALLLKAVTNSDHEAEDKEAIKQILNSVKPL